MKTNIVLLVSFVLCLGCVGQSPSGSEGSVAEYFFAPDFVVQHQRDIGLTLEQRQFIESATQSAAARIQEAEQRVRAEVQKLAPLVDKDRVDEAAVLAQSVKVGVAEQETRQVQLAMLIGIKNKLTPEQQAKLKAVKTRLQALQSKGEKIQAGFQRWQEQGRDPSPLAKIMQEVDALIREGKLDQAEAALDKALQLVAEPKAK